MSTEADFEEKEFETLFNCRIYMNASKFAPGLSIFSPGQALERSLGFDFALYLDPTSPTFKLLFGEYVGRLKPTKIGKKALAPIPARQASAEPQIKASNVFFQYKRPTYFGDNHRNRMWRRNDGTRREFLRFDVRTKRKDKQGNWGHDHDQLHALWTLSQWSESVWVRYVCPSVWLRPHLYEQFEANTLLEECALVAPSALRDKSGGTKRWHDYWTFLEGDPSFGRPNPFGALDHQQTYEALTTKVRDELDHTRLTLPQEVSRIAERTGEMMGEFGIFRERDRRSGKTWAERIYEVSEGVAEDFLDRPRKLQPTFGVEQPFAPLQGEEPPEQEKPNKSEMEQVSAFVRLAAFSKPLRLTWNVLFPAS